MRNSKGFSMVELAIVAAMISIVCVIAFPTMMPIIRDGRVKSETRKVVDHLKLARMIALRDVVETTISISNSKQITLKQIGSDGKEKIVRAVNVEYSAIYITARPHHLQTISTRN